MQAREEADGTLVLTHDATPWVRLLVALGLVFVATAVWDLTLGARGDERLVGLVGASATCFLAGLVMCEKARFTIDPNARTIVWRRRWGLRVREGALAFADVRSVGVQVPMGDWGVPSRRLCFQVLNAPEVPVTIGYAPDVDDELSRLAARVGRMLEAAPR